jgi:NADPH:quinone reductase-like Zn-dependent oxidoreductase
MEAGHVSGPRPGRRYGLAWAVGQRVLIHAAAGGVGSFAAFAKWKGPGSLQPPGRQPGFCSLLGADTTITYRRRLSGGGGVMDLGLMIGGATKLHRSTGSTAA